MNACGVWRRSEPERAFSLLETLVALAVMAAVTLGIAGGMRAAQVAGSDAGLSQIAFNAVRDEIERTKTQSVREVLDEFAGQTARTFEVAGLDGPAPGVPAGSNRLLSEQEAAVELGIPGLDLNFNGIADETRIDGSYRVLVFEVRVDWRTPFGVQTLRLIASTTDETG